MINKTKSGCGSAILFSLSFLIIGAVIGIGLVKGCDFYYFNQAVDCYDELRVIGTICESRMVEIEDCHSLCIDLEQERNGYKELYEICKFDKQKGLE